MCNKLLFQFCTTAYQHPTDGRETLRCSVGCIVGRYSISINIISEQNTNQSVRNVTWNIRGNLWPQAIYLLIGCLTRICSWCQFATVFNIPTRLVMPGDTLKEEGVGLSIAGGRAPRGMLRHRRQNNEKLRNRFW